MDVSHPQMEPFGVAVIIANRFGQILMHLRDDIPGIAWPGYWSLPSGLAEPGETPAEAVVRELAEETGLTIPLTQRLEFPKCSEGDRVVVFTGSWDGDPATLNLTEGVGLAFYAPEDLVGMLVPPWVMQAIEQLRDGGVLAT
ncbi:NUDIX hydrolase [Actinomadura sp. WAC 06369]|uniref:NUDIX hydrolase n=1 Tax=Actinomadura sp. WAC 06369 TaxID=2203193 RepID=UPI001F398C4F|nr:NUDIX domain-containing protein [Actinomadura sp. WAC 06369]